MNKIITVIILVLLIISCSDNEKTDKSEWTLLVYMSADNGLTSAAINDINEMELSNISDSLKIVVQIDFDENSIYDGVNRYEILPGTSDDIDSRLLKKMSDFNSADPDELVEFVNWGIDKFPAERYAVVVWSHGNGWRNQEKYICQDGAETISIAEGELRYAFSRFRQKPEITIFDACNMQTLEVISEIKDYTKFVIGSEDGIPTTGFPYYDILRDWEVEDSTENIAKHISTNFYESYFPGGSQNPQGDGIEVSVSAFKTAEYQSLFDGLDYIGKKYYDFHDITPFVNARNTCYEFNYMHADVDLMDFFTNLKHEANSDSALIADCDFLIEKINSAMVSQYSFYYPNLTGSCSIWFPTQLSLYQDLLSNYSHFDLAENSFLQLIKKIATFQ